MDDDLLARATLCAASLSRPQARRSLEAWPAHPRSTAAGERALERAAAAGIRALAPAHPEFPAALREIPDPPLLLWVKGVLPAGPLLSIVGARRPSARGEASARAFAAELARAGVAIVSGLAYGIDSAAHEGALAGGGPTVAVLASGLLDVTPHGRRGLAERILAGGGAWLSERPPDADARARHFPERNRLISGLAACTLVVEAREKSGSLWTARHALEQGREVGVVPGPIDSEQCLGTNRLLRDGATPILEAADLHAALLGPLAAQPVQRELLPDVSPAARAVLELLADGPCDVDALARALGRAPRELASALLELELDGRLRREGTRLALSSD